MHTKVLYIEDNRDNLTLVSRLLKAGPYELLQANTGMQGVQLAEQEQVDIILLDINLPDIDGYEVARRLRNNPQKRLASIPIIALTANALKGDEEKAFESGCTQYITKPLDIGEFIEQIEKLANKIR